MLDLLHCVKTETPQLGFLFVEEEEVGRSQIQDIEQVGSDYCVVVAKSLHVKMHVVMMEHLITIVPQFRLLVPNVLPKTMH